MNQSGEQEYELTVPNELETFRRRTPDLTVLKDQLLALLNEGLKTLGISGGIVMGRLKSPPSVVGKLRSRESQPEYKRAKSKLDVFTDLVGVRVLLPTTTDRLRMEAWVRDKAQGLWIDPVDRRRDGEVLEPDEFGYRSEHIIVTLGPHSPRWRDVPVEVLERLNAKGESTGRPICRAEIQLRTFAAHAWALHAHDQFYKSEGGRPDELKRASSKAAALLEAADDELARVAWEVAAFESPVLSVRSRKLADQELEDLKDLLESVEGAERDGILLRSARLLRLLGRWDEALEALERCTTENADVACEGVALHAFRAIDEPTQTAISYVSLEHLITQSKPMALTSDHYCDFAEACLLFYRKWTREQGNPARQYSEEALRLEPRSPRAFRNYVIACMLDSPFPAETVRALAPRLVAAAELSRARAQQQVYVPWAYFDAALFTFLVTSLSESADAIIDGQPDETLVACYDDLLLGIELWRRAVDSDDQPVPYPMIIYHHFLQTLVEEFSDTKERLSAELASMRDILTLAISANGPESEPARARLRTVLQNQLKESGVSIPQKKHGGRLVILAGACAESLEPLLNWYREPFLRAFKDFEGVLISGGTTAGISGIAQILGTPGKLVRRGYLEVGRFKDIRKWDDGLEFVKFSGVKSTPCEVLAYWRDAMLAGFNPAGPERDCLLLGVDGGVISAFEYKLAIALGARAGIFNDPELLAARGNSHPSAWRALNDSPIWNTSTNFIPMPKDPHIPYVFLRMPAHAWVSDSAMREQLAEQTHNSYRDVVARFVKTIDDYHADWQFLNEKAKESNRNQIDTLPHILAHAGLFIVRNDEGEKLLATGQYETVDSHATDGEVEMIARLEHARWCIERLAAGWRYGPQRDNANKLRPQLVGWEELKKLRAGKAEAEMEKDRAVARGLTEVLKMLNENGTGYMLLRRKVVT
jgi:ppGpp synthetase/RelA/SpoT-type nucleotidyltranferase